MSIFTSSSSSSLYQIHLLLDNSPSLSSMSHLLSNTPSSLTHFISRLGGEERGLPGAEEEGEIVIGVCDRGGGCSGKVGLFVVVGWANRLIIFSQSTIKFDTSIIATVLAFTGICPALPTGNPHHNDMAEAIAVATYPPFSSHGTSSTFCPANLEAIHQGATIPHS